MLHSRQWFANRTVDNTIQDDTGLSPIDGYQSQALVSLEQAVHPIEPLIDSLVNYVKVAKERCYYPNKHGLTRDQSASVYLYTMEWGNKSFYRLLNTALRTEDRNTLKCWFSFLKLFDTALKKLPLFQQNVWRGIRSPLGGTCKKGDELIWWSISSCSFDVHVIEKFLVANGTLFLIEALSGRDISGYTSYPNEHEIILPPGIHLKVLADSMGHSGGLHIVHTRELPSSIIAEDQALQQNSWYSKIIPKCLRIGRKGYWLAVATIIFIILGLVIGVSVALTTRKQNSTDSIHSNLSQNATLIIAATSYVTRTTVTFGNIEINDTTDEQLFGTQSANPNLLPDIDNLQELGVRIFRIPVSWRQLEENGKNNISFSYLNKLDHLILTMEQGDIRVLLYMIDTPCWASSSSECKQFKYRPKDYNDYADAMVFLLKHYQKRVYAWEIWNEPNLSENWLRSECQSNNGECPRQEHSNDEYMEFIDLIGAREYSEMVKITYQKMKSIDSNVTILAGSLAGSDIEYLNEMYKSSIRDYFTALSMHPYISPYRKPTNQDAEEYGPDECPSSTNLSKFWCFQHGVEQIRQQMILHMDQSKLIWLTEFGFSSSKSGRKYGPNRQMYYLERSMDIIQQQWSFVHVACYYEYSDQGNEAPRKGLFGLLFKNFDIKKSGVMFIRKTKRTQVASSSPTRTTLQTTLPTALTLYPIGEIDTDTPYFSWPRVPNADSYYLHVNDYGVPNIAGRIAQYYSPVQANCHRNNDEFCRVTPSVRFTKNGGEWWVRVFPNDDGSDTHIVNAVFFTIKSNML